MFFQHENRFRYKFFDIVQFSRSCAPQVFRPATRLFYHKSDFLSSTFFRSFSKFIELGRSKFLGTNRNFFTSIGSFQRLPAELQKSFFCLSAWRSSIIPYPPPPVNTFLQIFSSFCRMTGNRFILLRFALIYSYIRERTFSYKAFPYQ